MHFAERRALTMLRKARMEQAAGGYAIAESAFARLVGLPVNMKMAIRTVDAPFASADELILLSWIASMQRPTGVPRDASDQLLVRTIDDCAQILKALGHILPHRTIARTQQAQRQVIGDDPTKPVRRFEGQGDAGGSVGQSYNASSVGARAIALAKSNELVSTGAFRAVGVSRQMVGKLRKDGLLVRVRHGLYRWSGFEASRSL